MTAGSGPPLFGLPVLAIETATRRAVVALGRLDGSLLALDEWDPGHRHAEDLLGRIGALLARAGIGRPAPGVFAGIIVGTGPGGFTGLRVGLATAHGIARAAAAPLVGVSTGAALTAAARVAGRIAPGTPVELVLPAGPAGRYLMRDGRATLEPGSDAPPDPRPGAVLVAVDLAGRAPDQAVAWGVAAQAGLAAALVELGAARLRDGADDGGTLGPEYVTLPRGVAAATEEVAWSPARP